MGSTYRDVVDEHKKIKTYTIDQEELLEMKLQNITDLEEQIFNYVQHYSSLFKFVCQSQDELNDSKKEVMEILYRGKIKDAQT